MKVIGRPWAVFLAAGLVAWVAAAAGAFVSGSAAFAPPVVLIGALLIPVTFLIWMSEPGVTGDVPPSLVPRAMLAGGLVGVVDTLALPLYFREPNRYLFLAMALAEELVLAAVLVYAARRLTEKNVRSGLLLGAAVGFGFAIPKAVGWSLVAALTVRDMPVAKLTETELLRALFTPLGPGLWTAILGGALFAVSRGGRIRINGRVVLTYLGVVALHFMWDAARTVAIVLALVLTDLQYTPAMHRLGQLPSATAAQAHIYTGLLFASRVIVTGVTLVWLMSQISTAWRDEPRYLIATGEDSRP
ncbi:PrsW family glutamic-type intramembrane protease [Bailinhaonella thermotolerans]|uniref:PrsW family intramembrane metalloprotease n=1 Tax=Bailinhaonella thermotolerans TaxID=1070861 RepID=A0A3A4BNA3_9ACTN|nr:PrsW family glutamic-type intramembrane protease [Bailinhaonella thermotolerans]RJL32544.1 PrsW family intramembrane metalloprotease [Bailinhaonella thermotolerans]